MRTPPLRQGLSLGLLALVVVWLSVSIWGLLGKARIAMSEAREVEQQYVNIQARKASLQASVDALSTEYGRDAAIRTAFGVARPGEEVIVVVPPKEATTTPEPTLWQRVLNWF